MVFVERRLIELSACLLTCEGGEPMAEHKITLEWKRETESFTYEVLAEDRIRRWRDGLDYVNPLGSRYNFCGRQ